MSTQLYEVIVSNIGCVYSGPNKRDALFHARSYVDASKTRYGRASGESVTVLNSHGDIVEEYHGELEQQS